MLPFPHIDPVALQIGPLAIRWYALAYIAGIVIGYQILKRVSGVRQVSAKKPGLTSETFLDDLMTYSVIGIILGIPPTDRAGGQRRTGGTWPGGLGGIGRAAVACVASPVAIRVELIRIVDGWAVVTGVDDGVGI